jgi:acyl-CoA thioesterase FadM
MFHISYVRFAERALFDLVRTIWPGFGPREWMVRFRVAICGVDVRYLRATRLGDRLDIWTGVVDVGPEHLGLGHRFVAEGSDEVAAELVTRVEFRDEQERVIPLPRQAADIARANLFLASRLRFPREG